MFPGLDHIRPTASMEDQRKAAMELIIRVLGPRSSHFIIVIVENKDPDFKDKFNVSTLYLNFQVWKVIQTCNFWRFHIAVHSKCVCKSHSYLNKPKKVEQITKLNIYTLHCIPTLTYSFTRLSTAATLHK